MRRINRILIVTASLSFLALSACMEGTGDVLVAADGTVIEGELLTIGSGRAVFSHESVDVPDRGRVWDLDGGTFHGEIAASSGIIRSGSHSIARDSLYLIVWGDTDVDIETFTVDAASGWLDTGIELEQGEILSLHGTGTVVTETGSSNPQGQEKYSSSVSLVPGATSGQLVFQVGADGQPVAAGSSWIGESPAAGTLLLAVNVPLEGSMESRGVYSVVVKAGSVPNRPGTVVFYPAGR